MSSLPSLYFEKNKSKYIHHLITDELTLDESFSSLMSLAPGISSICSCMESVNCEDYINSAAQTLIKSYALKNSEKNCNTYEIRQLAVVLPNLRYKLLPKVHQFTPYIRRILGWFLSQNDSLVVYLYNTRAFFHSPRYAN